MRGRLVFLTPEEILLPQRDSRHEGDIASECEEPLDDPNFSQLVRSITELGMVQPVTVRLVGAGDGDQSRYELVAGRRRQRAYAIARPNEKMPCFVREEVRGEAGGRVDAAGFDAFLCNVTENMHRRRLRPWELAEDFYGLHLMQPDLPKKHLAKKLGVSEQYFHDLMAVRQKLLPAIFDRYRTHAESMKISLKTMTGIARRPRDEQMAEWNRFVDSRRKMVGTGRHFGSKERAPGERKLRRYLSVVHSIKDQPRVWRQTVAWALRVALGDDAWPYGTVRLDERKTRLRGRPRRATTGSAE